MNPSSEVSLYIPCYNAAPTIEKCLDSVLKQTYPTREIIVIDDGSTDNSAELIKKYPVTLLANRTNKGLVYCRNLGCRKASGEFIAALDSDCAAAPQWLERLVEVIKKSNAAGAGGRLIEKNTRSLADRWRLAHMGQEWGRQRLDNPPFLFGSNTVFRRQALEKAGFYNEKLVNNFEDVELSRRLYKRNYSLIYDPDACAEHLRTDTISSVLSNYWQWQESQQAFEAFSQDAPRGKLKKLGLRLRRVRNHGGLFLKHLAAQDLRERHYLLLAVDIMFLLYFLWQDAKSIVKEIL